jgi:hypothetical protein
MARKPLEAPAPRPVEPPKPALATPRIIEERADEVFVKVEGHPYAQGTWVRKDDAAWFAANGYAWEVPA